MLIINYLIKLLVVFIVLFINISNVYSNNINKILFKIKDQPYTSLDINYRKNYLKLFNDKKILEYEEIINDLISVAMFNEYYEKYYTKLNFNDEIDDIYYQLIKNNIPELNKEIIIKNIQYDVVRKTIIEDILNTKKNNIFNDTKDLDLIYNFNVKYLTMQIDDYNKIKNKFNLENRNDLLKLEDYLTKSNFKFYTKENEVINSDNLKKEIKNLIDKNKKFIIDIYNNYVSLISIEKKLESYEGMIANIVFIETNKKIPVNLLNCDKLNMIDENIIISKVSNNYEYTNLNDEIKKNIYNINDFLIYKNKDKFSNVILCNLEFNKKILEEIDINKKISNLANEIENNFIKKYSNEFSLEIIYE